MRVVKRIEPLSAMKVAGILYGILGLFIGAILSVLALSGIFSSPLTGGGMPGWFPGVFGALAVVIFPIFYAVLGAVMAGLMAVFYNLAARFVGGLEVDVV
jgi:hypothetical protein